MAENIEYRIEHDTMGEVRVPANALYRAQTQRAVDNFPISGQTLESAHIRALALVKKAAATANEELQVLDAERAQAIREAADLVATGEYDEHFPIDVFQTGSGTSSNMNTNEVLATLATRSLESQGIEVHPNDHVNASQSSNDVFPTSVHVAVTEALVKELIPALEVSRCIGWEKKSAEFKDVVKSGRTHLMDATPITLGQEFSGYAATVRYGIERVNASLPRVAEVPLGGTAVGTGINTPAGFSARVIELLAEETSTRPSRFACASKWLRASVRGRPVSSASSSITRAEKPAGVLIPVPTAVPPRGTSATRGRDAFTRSMP